MSNVVQFPGKKHVEPEWESVERSSHDLKEAAEHMEKAAEKVGQKTNWLWFFIGALLGLNLG